MEPNWTEWNKLCQVVPKGIDLLNLLSLCNFLIYVLCFVNSCCIIISSIMFLFVPMFFCCSQFWKAFKGKNSWVPTKKCICLILFDLCSVFCFFVDCNYSCLFCAIWYYSFFWNYYWILLVHIYLFSVVQPPLWSLLIRLRVLS